MTRINTNVASLVGRNNLAQANASLSQSLTRLSTGLRINTGADDPAGLIASENLRSDITSIERAIGNTERAEQVIATADSALGQVSSLLNDIRGLVTESANAGALSDDQIAANQLQVDSSLEALNRIAQTTTFQGRRLLDGSLDFITSADGANSNFTSLSDLNIDQANLGAAGEVSVDINVSAAATQASLNIGGIAPIIAGGTSTGTITFSDAALAATADASFDVETASATQATGAFELTSEVTVAATASGFTTIDLGLLSGGGSGNTIDFTADSSGAAGNVTLDFVVGGATGGVTVSAGSGADGETLTVTINDDATIGNLVTALDGAANGAVNFSTSGSAGSGDATALSAVGDGSIRADLVALAPAATSTTSGVDQDLQTRQLTFSTDNTGAGRDFNVQILTDTSANIGGTSSVVGTAAAGFTVTIANDANVDLGTLATSIQNEINDNLGGDGLGGDVTVGLTGGASVDLILANGNSVAPNEVGVGTSNLVNIGGSSDATVETLTIGIAADQALGASPNGVAINFQTGTVAGPGNGGDATDPTNRVAVSGDITNGFLVTIDTTESVSFDAIAAAIGNQTGIDAGSITIGSTNLGALSGTTDFNAVNPPANQANTTLASGRDAGDDVITITADAQDASFDGALTFTIDNSTAGGITVARDGNGDVNVSVNSASAYNLIDITNAITNQLDGFTATLANNGSGTFSASNPDDGGGAGQAAVEADITGGQAGSGGLAADAVIELVGSLGSEVFNLRAGTGLQGLIDQINLVSDATGVQAAAGADNQTLELTSTEFGSDSVVQLDIVEEDESTGTFSAAVGAGARGSRSVGQDVVATVNGVQANGDGNRLSINTATLDLSTSVEANFTGTVSFNITGGGALFQLGPDVVTNQQARLGISSVNTAALGGVSGALFQLASGQSADLTSDPTTAAAIVEEAINEVTSLRGRLGAFQRTTLETNRNALNDTLSNLTEAESSIRDADFAAETAELTRSQILVQSGTRVLAIANQNPQNVLALLG